MRHRAGAGPPLLQRPPYLHACHASRALRSLLSPLLQLVPVTTTPKHPVNEVNQTCAAFASANALTRNQRQGVSVAVVVICTRGWLPRPLPAIKAGHIGNQTEVWAGRMCERGAVLETAARCEEKTAWAFQGAPTATAKRSAQHCAAPMAASGACWLLQSLS